jgi:hypothetical protein
MRQPMGGKTSDEILGSEYDWLAGDADGRVALFSTAGGGYAPEAFLLDTDAHDAAIDTILASPASTVARFSPQLPPGLKNTWRVVAERGLFAFDSDPQGGPYRLVAAPQEPIRLSELPGPASTVVGQLVFPHLRFMDLREIPKELLQQRP